MLSPETQLLSDNEYTNTKIKTNINTNIKTNINPHTSAMYCFHFHNFGQIKQCYAYVYDILEKVVWWPQNKIVGMFPVLVKHQWQSCLLTAVWQPNLMADGCKRFSFPLSLLFTAKWRKDKQNFNEKLLEIFIICQKLPEMQTRLLLISLEVFIKASLFLVYNWNN